MTVLPPHVEALSQRLDVKLSALEARDRRYRGIAPLRYAADEITGDLKFFGVNLCRLAVDAVAERMRVKKITARAGNRDVTSLAQDIWLRNDLDQLLQPVLVDALAMGSSYLTVWADADGRAVLTPESARSMAVSRHPVTGKVTGALKRWNSQGPSGAVTSEHVYYYGARAIERYERSGAGDWVALEPIPNPLGVVPVIPLINVDRVGDVEGHSVIDELGHLVDALSKVLADMLVASEDVARPRRWASGVDLEESEGPTADGFTADAAIEAAQSPAPAVSPFESGNRMFTVESPDAKFGQLPGADLKGYSTAVDLLLQQIMAVSALPAHMMGVTTSNPASADALRASEASLTARSESRIRVLGVALERAVNLAIAVELLTDPADVTSQLHWASAATKSTAQEADAITKLHALGIITTAEAREQLGYDGLEA